MLTALSSRHYYLSSQLFLTLMVCAIAFAPSAIADENPNEAHSLADVFQKGSFKGFFRYSGQYRNSNVLLLQDGSDEALPDVSVRQYSAWGGFAGFQTAPWHGWSGAATFYTSIPIGNNPDSRRGLGGLNEDNGSQESYHVFGELFVEYARNGHLFRAGKQEMPDFRYVSLSDIRMTPITHEGAIYRNSTQGDLGLNVGYITRMKERNAENFIDMATGARLKLEENGKQLVRGDFNPDYFDESGYIGPSQEMLMAGLLYQGQKFNVEAWNYYVTDFVNTVYLYADYRFGNGPLGIDWSVAAQYSDQYDVGDAVGGSVDTWHWGISLRGSKGPSYFFANYNEVAYNEDSYDGGTLFVRWGTPQMFMSFQVQDSELAGTRSWGVGYQYDFGARGFLPHFVMRWRYGDYDMPDDLALTDARADRREATFDVRWSLQQDRGFGIFTKMKGWSAQFRAAYNNYRTDYDYDAYREIHGYTFDTVTDDFWDVRLYAEYRF